MVKGLLITVSSFKFYKAWNPRGGGKKSSSLVKVDKLKGQYLFKRDTSLS